MAKKVTKKTGELPNPMAMIKGLDPTVETLSESVYSNITGYVSTGNLLLNAAISGSMFGGIPEGRIVTLAGESGSAKSFCAVSCCREWLELGKKRKTENPEEPDYAVLYLDSEGAIDNKFVERLGCDSSQVAIKQVNTIDEVTTIIRNLCDTLTEQEEEYGKHQRWMIVLDSLGNLTSQKELADSINANYDSRDMTKAQRIKAMFRVCATPCAKMHIPWIVVSHVYSSMSMYSSNSISGGSGIIYAGSTIVEMSKSKLDDKESNEAAAKAAGKDNQLKAGIQVNCRITKSRSTRPMKISFQIPFYKKPNKYVGLESFLSWEQGVCRGTMIDEKTYNKMSDAEKNTIHVFEKDGVTYYAQPKDTARGIVCKHLDPPRQVSFQEFFSDVVFTDEFLHMIDDSVIKPTFCLPDHDVDDISELENMIDNSDTLNDDANLD